MSIEGASSWKTCDFLSYAYWACEMFKKCDFVIYVYWTCELLTVWTVKKRVIFMFYACWACELLSVCAVEERVILCVMPIERVSYCGELHRVI